MFYDKSVVAQILAITRLTRLTRLHTAVEYFIREHGFQCYFFVINSTVSLNPPEPLRLHNLADDWVRLYRDEHLINTDPLVHYALNHHLPLDWRSLMTLPDYDTGEQRRVMILRAHHGMASGCTVPLAIDGLHARFNLISEEDGERAWDHAHQFLPYALLLGNVILERTRTLRGQDGTTTAQQREAHCAEALNSRERECLVWASAGHTNNEIGQRLGITERTVVYHISNACRKLRARNRQHAVTRAILSRQLPLEGLPVQFDLQGGGDD
ncbi:LuxR family transcriptional regulator [Alcanivorax xiamenensis]|uniref:LuxR family transcriptional regulator n=1 Tax=Alcanivorax xiamenensis TaxID=1177156 RepID=A0ABQ6YB79_9GAMM|nr:LuxR family transcriptional regulator [Alcanivorax xiamenensis]KAF0807286.1 LuxR family transcriptional regulator [Alcanivorax xiamenensis]